jgi:hypothetical protein
MFALLLSHLASALPSLVMVGGAAGLPLGTRLADRDQQQTLRPLARRRRTPRRV